jgi:hypothetical protein
MDGTPRVDLDTVLVRSRNHLSGDIDREIVLLSIDKGEYYQLNGPGGRIWELFEQPLRVAAVVDRLCEEFEVERPACEVQVLEFLQRMLAEGLVERPAAGTARDE